jgi:hypothetical protein
LITEKRLVPKPDVRQYSAAAAILGRPGRLVLLVFSVLAVFSVFCCTGEPFGCWLFGCWLFGC